MEIRELILKDYFELQRTLNKANKLKNETNTLSFSSEIESDLTVRLFAKTEHARLLICKKIYMGKWQVYGQGDLFHLKSYIVDILNQKGFAFNNFDQLIKHSIHELLNYHSTDF
jgi:hypothetical protein